ncbi:MAG: hypothetical protein CR217_10840 [Beijerinckiaceae bacterium]|nr:MAG: hypothetical protein CR217_10840 [Beijerinckiaceae bacterium]
MGRRRATWPRRPFACARGGQRRNKQKNHAAKRDWSNGALGGIVAQLFFSVRLSFRATDPTQTRHTRMGETTAAVPLRRGLVHACLIVIHNWRKPALGLRDAHAIAAGVIPRVLSLARSRDAAVWHPNKREYQEP